MIGWPGLVRHYAAWFDLEGVDEVVTLYEGNTPLLYAERVSERVGANVWLKFDGMNPTGSFKDRGMTVAITKARARGAKTVICGSTGNTSAAAAAYAAKAGMDCVVLVPEGKIALGKLARPWCTAHGSCRFGATSTRRSTSRASSASTCPSPS